MAENFQNHNERTETNEFSKRSIDENLNILSDRIVSKYGDYDRDGYAYRQVLDENGKTKFNAEFKGEVLRFLLDQRQLIEVLQITDKILSIYKKNKSNDEFYTENGDFPSLFLNDSIINDTDYLSYEKIKSILGLEENFAHEVKENNEKINNFISEYSIFLNKVIKAKEKEYIKRETFNIKEINENLGIFDGMDLETIKNYINTHAATRVKHSLIFLKSITQKPYIIKEGDLLNQIRNFTSKDFKVHIIHDDINIGDKITLEVDKTGVLRLKNNNYTIGYINVNKSLISILEK